MKTKLLIFILLLSFNSYSLPLLSRSNFPITASKRIDSSIDNNSPFTIVYDIQVKTSKHKTGIEETYNGGIKVVFIQNDMARVRMVSLMRIQSLFFSCSVNSNQPVSIVKESGKNKYKYNLTNEQWNSFNIKYEKDSCVFTNDSAVILNYLCRKAIVILKDGRSLTVYYAPQLKPIDSKIEPAFNGIPGLVLQYEYDYKKGTVIYTASKISQASIAGSIFKIPNKGYRLKKYCSSCTSKEINVSEDSGLE